MELQIIDLLGWQQGPVGTGMPCLGAAALAARRTPGPPWRGRRVSGGGTRRVAGVLAQAGREFADLRLQRLHLRKQALHEGLSDWGHAGPNGGVETFGARQFVHAP